VLALSGVLEGQKKKKKKVGLKYVFGTQFLGLVSFWFSTNFLCQFGSYYLKKYFNVIFVANAHKIC
jgi:hypothetical protein